MKSLYTGKIEEENLARYLSQVNMSDRDKKLIERYLDGNITYRDLGEHYGITGERVRQIVEKFARKAHHIYKKELTAKEILVGSFQKNEIDFKITKLLMGDDEVNEHDKVH